MDLIKEVKTKKFWTDGVGSLFLAVLLALCIRWAFLEAYVIPSGSMLPSLLINDHIFVNKIIYGIRVPFTGKWMARFSDPKRGEVIVFRPPDEPNRFFIKRIVGIPGDRIFYENGNLYVNDELIENKPAEKKKSEFNWLRESDFAFSAPNALKKYDHFEETLGENTFSILLKKDSFHGNFGPYTVPEESYFVLGDNRDHSSDSRLWRTSHFVPMNLVLGRASFVWLSCDETISWIPFLCNPLELRWSRFFHFIH